MKQLFLLAALSLSAVTAQADTFDPATNTLTMDSVIVGDQKYFNVVVRIDQFTVLGVGSSVPIGGVNEICGTENFTIDKFNAIQSGMSIDQINQTIGCKFDPGSAVRTGGLVNYHWMNATGGNVQFISVFFDESSLKVTAAMGNQFKSSAGF